MFRMWIVCAIIALSGAALAQPPDNSSGAKGGRESAGLSGRMRGLDERGSTTTIRESILLELRHVPALDKHLKRIIDLQQARFDLQRERIAMAEKSRRRERDSDFELFHSLLRQDEEITEKQKTALRQLVNDLNQIQRQIKARKVELERESSYSDGTSTATRSLQKRRSLRFYDFLEAQLEDIKENPNRPDHIYRLLRGFRRGFEGEGHSLSDDPQKRMKDLQRLRRELTGRLEEVNAEIEELKPDLTDGKSKPKSTARTTSGSQALD